MNEAINLELAKLQDELKTLDTAVKHIEKAGKIASSVVDATKDIQQKYKLQLEEVGKQFNSYIEKLYSFTENKLIDISSLHEKQVEEFNKVLRDYAKLSEVTDKLMSKVDKIDFPLRLDRIEDIQSKLKSMLQDVQLDAKTTEQNFKEDVNSVIDQLVKLNSGATEQSKNLIYLANLFQSRTTDNMQQIQTHFQSLNKRLDTQDKKVRSVSRKLNILVLVFVALGISFVILFLYAEGYLNQWFGLK